MNTTESFLNLQRQIRGTLAATKKASVRRGLVPERVALNKAYQAAHSAWSRADDAALATATKETEAALNALARKRNRLTA